MFREAFGAENVAIGLWEKDTIASYLALREATAGLEGAKPGTSHCRGADSQIARFDENLCPVVILNKQEHEAITKLLRDTVLDPTHVRSNDLTMSEILKGYREAYRNHRGWLALVEDYLKK